MKKIYLTALMIIALAFMVMPSTAQANLLLNPSFESGTGADADNWIESAAGTERSGWAARTGDWGMIICGVGDYGHSGTGDVSQVVSAISDTPYVYSIWTNRDAGDPLGGSYYMQLEWYNGASLIQTDTNAVIPVADTWQQEVYNITSPSATIDSVKVMFGQTLGTELSKWDDADFGSTAVPEPATIMLLGSGLIGLLGFARKKRS